MEPLSPAPVRAAAAPLRLLLVEDDEGDAFLVSELLQEEDPSIEVQHVRSLAAAVDAVAADPPDCVLLDLGLPDATGLGALERLRAAAPGVAHPRAHRRRDVQRGVEAVAAGAQDYLIKGSVDGECLRRAVRYAVERRQADAVRAAAARRARCSPRRRPAWSAGCSRPAARRRAASASGPATAPAASGRCSAATSTTPWRRRTARVHLVIGDVAGHGPDEAALGVCLRVAWRTLDPRRRGARRRPPDAPAGARPRALCARRSSRRS